MCALMYLQHTLLCECFITQITVKWTLPSMCALMYLQRILLCECFITQITLKWMLATSPINFILHIFTVLLIFGEHCKL
jgi:hypothetical protein